jgi:CRISPR-associated protein Cmr2
MANNYFHFTLGPVQGFVSQARRTRDFWAGSFLLSWLSGVAMAEIKRQKGEIQFPSPAVGYLDWITGQPSKSEAPRQGGIPNRFKAFEAKVPTGFNGELVAETIRQAWLALADHVWQQDQLGDHATPQTRAIWQRQHEHFWEISWALTSDEQVSSLLDQRKNWRSHYPKSEGGVKCMVMDGWQELSGAERPGLEEKGRTTVLKSFWQAVRTSGVTGMQTDLAKHEHLCALAYVKRRFVRHFASFAVTLPSGLSLKGWQLQAGIPSVSYMAAVHWLEKLANTADVSELQAILSAAQAVNASSDEWDTRVRCLTQVWKNSADGGIRRKLLSLDGNLFFEHAQDNAKAYGYDVTAVERLQKTIRDFKDKHSEFDEPLSPFYAVLLMDGDSLGVHMSDKANQEPISTALNLFTAYVPEIVETHNGFLIYAGGDDVLAILPLEDAMRCAAAVRNCYFNSFKNYPAIKTSISAAIQYAHVKTPLGKILGDAHGLLDDVAKDGAGRDALAVRVWKPGGMALQWAQPWEVALEGGEPIIEKLARKFTQDEQGQKIEFSNKFFFKIRERFDVLNPAKKKDGSYEEKVLNEGEALSLLAVDFKNSGENRDMTMAQAESIIGPLLNQCRAITRDKDLCKEQWKKSDLLQVDGALLVRFLAQKGVE